MVLAPRNIIAAVTRCSDQRCHTQLGMVVKLLDVILNVLGMVVKLLDVILNVCCGS